MGARSWLASAFALLVLAAAAQAGQQPSAADLVARAEEQLKLGRAKDALKSCQRALKLGLADPRLQARAHNLTAIALVATSGGQEKVLQKAEEELTLGVQASPEDADILYNRGYVRLRLRRDGDGTADLRRVLELRPGGAAADRARRLIADPRRARERFLPEFSLVTLQGETLDPQRLKGRVVLIDFWATWCAPCRDAIPEIKALLKKYPGERLMVLSISADHDQDAWKEFVGRNQMTLRRGRAAARAVRRARLPHLPGGGRRRHRARSHRGHRPAALHRFRLKEMLARFPELAAP
jgi:thiol-disulfide isomerase/thioredoxin